MPTLKVVFNNTTKVARVLDDGAATPGGFTHVGNFDHPDATYPDSVEIYHGIRDLLYKRSAANPANPGFWPDNIVDMQGISIDMQATPRLRFLQDLHKNEQFYKNTGESLVLEIKATGGVEPYLYAWFLDEAIVDGAEEATLVLGPITNAMAGSYYCEVTDDDGLKINSNSVSLFVTGADLEPDQTIAFTTNLPASDTYTNSTLKQLVIVATGSGTLTYAWYKDNVALVMGSEYGGVATATLTLPDPDSPDQNGVYFCRVTDDNGTLDSVHCTLTQAP